MAIDAARSGGGLDALKTNLQAVQRGKAYGIDQDGELIGEAVKGSFKGKVVDLLVSRGLAKPGNLGGRIAVSLVGKDNFDLIINAHKDRRHASSVGNAIALIHKHETAGLDDDLKTAVSSRIGRSFNAKITPLRSLTGAKIDQLHNAIQNEVVPARTAFRDGIAEGIGNGRATKTIATSGQVSVETAALAISEGKTDLAQVRELTTPYVTLGQESDYDRRALVIVTEFNGGLASVRANAAGEAKAEGLSGDEAQAHVDGRADEFKQQFLEVLTARHQALDVQDGIGPRRDGSESAPVKQGYTDEELASTVVDGGRTPFAGGKTPFKAQAPITPRSKEQIAAGKQPDSARSRDLSGGVRFAGGVESTADDIGPRKATAQYMFDGIQEMLADKPDAQELAGAVKDLTHLVMDNRFSAADRQAAAQMLGNPALIQSYDNVAMAVFSLDKVAQRDPAAAKQLAQGFFQHADPAQLRNVVNRELAFTNDVVAQLRPVSDQMDDHLASLAAKGEVNYDQEYGHLNPQQRKASEFIHDFAIAFDVDGLANRHKDTLGAQSALGKYINETRDEGRKVLDIIDKLS